MREFTNEKHKGYQTVVNGIIIMENAIREARVPMNSSVVARVRFKIHRSWEQIIEEHFGKATTRQYQQPQPIHFIFEWSYL